MNAFANRRADRLRMVEGQLVVRGIRDVRVLAAMGEIPRELFVSAEHAAYAYQDTPLPIGHGQTISQPFMVAFMAQLLHLRGEETVLEIGAGSGYNAAVLSRLAKRVIAMERIPGLLEQAQNRWRDLHCDNIQGIVGDGTLGWPEAAPYHGIIVTAGAPAIPQPLLPQLLPETGCMVIPVGSHRHQVLWQVRRSALGDAIIQEHFGCVFVPLVGEAGWAG